MLFPTMLQHLVAWEILFGHSRQLLARLMDFSILYNNIAHLGICKTNHVCDKWEYVFIILKRRITR